MAERPIALPPAKPVIVMTHKLSSAMLRRWSMQCAAQADSARFNGNERQYLLKMRTSLLDLADAQDWLDGKSPNVGVMASPEQSALAVRTVH